MNNSFKLDDTSIWCPTPENPWVSPIKKYKRVFVNNELLEIFPENSINILDIGCGNCKFTSRPKDDVIGLDHVNFDCVDILLDVTKSKLPFDDGSIDFVVSSHFIEHLDYQERDLVFGEIWRVLRPGGLFFFRVPHFSHFHSSAYDHKIYNYGAGVAHTIGNSSWYSHIPKFYVISVGMNWRQFSGFGFINRILNKILNLSFRLTEAYLCYLVGGVEEIQFLLYKP